MATRSQMRGWPVYWDGNVWRYSDDHSLAPASGGAERPCTACGLVAEGDYGPDPCLGYIEGVTGACCGHGVEAAVVNESGGEVWSADSPQAPYPCYCGYPMMAPPDQPHPRGTGPLCGRRGQWSQDSEEGERR